jgi:hypothetical protein
MHLCKATLIIRSGVWLLGLLTSGGKGIGRDSVGF